MTENEAAGPGVANTPPEAAAETGAAAKSLAGMVECLLFVAGEPLSLRDMARATGAGEAEVQTALETLIAYRYGETAPFPSGLQVMEIAGGFQLATRPEGAGAVGRLLSPHANRLSRPALETVTIVAYRQPCTQGDIEAIRGVASDGVVKTLLERELIRDAGRKATPGRPILYATTDAFLHYFGLRALEDMPMLDEDDFQTTEAARVALHAAGAA